MKLLRSPAVALLLGLLTFLPWATVAQVPLVPAGAVWKYLDDGSNPGTAWRALGFNDSAWPSGPAELGYGDATEGRPERTVLSYGPNPNAKPITCYFRRAFTVGQPGAFTNLVLGLLRDDGAVVYLNGSEVWRHNLPAGTITYTTPASSSVTGADEYTFFRTNLSPALLRAGTNLLAVEVHQASANSSDLSFDLFLVGQTGALGTNALTLYVAPQGHDDWTGSHPQPTGADGPLATLERARDVLRSCLQAGLLPPGGAVVEVAGGVYPLDRPLDLSAADSGAPDQPIVWRARPGEEARVLGGRRLGGFTRTTDPALLARLDPVARGKVWQADLRAQGLTSFPAPVPGTSWAQSDPGLELFFNDRPMTLARYPNEGWLKIAKALGPTPVDIRGTVGTAEGIFSCADPRLARWVGEPDVMVHGFWFWDWADQRHRVASIDTVSNVITLFTNSTYRAHTYGYRDGQWFYAYNLLPELDEPGEWYLDRQSGLLYFWPPAPLESGTALVALLPGLVALTNVSHVTLEGFIFEGAQGTAITISGGATNGVRACTVRNVGKNGIRIVNSPGSGVSGCEITLVGDGGIILSGGNRSTLTPGGLYAEDNHIHHYSRWNPVYHAGISLSGVGHRVAHNLIHNAPHEGIAFGGNDHVIEFNEFHSLVEQSNDAGVIYGGRTWTARGHVIRFNYFHHLYGFERRGCNAVYLDDQFSSATVYGNLFYDVHRALLVGGGRDNYVLNNLFVKCRTAISLDARGLGWAASAFTTLSNELVSLPYQSPPWSTRYPELTNILNENPMAPRGNVFATNVAWGGGWTSIESAAQAGVLVTNNLVGVDPLLMDSNRWNFQLRSNSPAWSIGFDRLPLERIGPRTNVLRAPWTPTASIVQPAPGAVLAAQGHLALELLAPDPGRVLEAVELFIGNARLGEASAYPHRFTWSNAPPGHYALQARTRFGTDTWTLLRPVRVRVDEALVPSGAVWKYLDNGSDQGTAWRGTNFNDGAWPSGPAQLGYGDGDEATVLSYGPDPNNKRITYYFRRAFTVADPTRYAALVLGLLRDDGAVVYLNGAEVLRSNMPEGAIHYRTLALTAVSDAGENTFYPTNLSPALLHRGTNWLAVEVHQVNGQSSDLSFDLYLHGLAGDAVPRLAAQRVAGGVGLSWPVGAAGLALESAPTLTLPPSWTPAPGLPLVVGDQVQLTVEPDTPSRFFRLASP